MKKIGELIECSYDIDIFGIADDSRNVREGFLFVATKGFYVDHYDYIVDAINNGAVCIIADRTIDVNVPVIIVDDVNNCYFDLCGKFFDIDINDFNFIGVTGTDGKTTTTTIVNELLNKYVNHACIGTNGVIVGREYFSTNNTTPCVFEFFEDLNRIRNCKCKDVIMEVSSEALLHDRLKKVKYDIVAFTNITEDHLNIHKTIENYRKCKFKLLELLKNDSVVIINGDDVVCRQIDACNLYRVGMNNDNDFVISNVKEMSDCVNFTITCKDCVYDLNSPLLGLYNVYNVAMAFVICLMKGANPEFLIDDIANISSIRGRRENIDFGQDYKIILDYAHTYNGIKNMLESVFNYNKVITVTGAAGGREKEKRSKIGKLVLENSDVTIFTMDDPRFEDVNDIIDQMAMDSDISYLRITDRKNAIFKALDMATSDSVVLILGKGRDNYMAIEDRKEPYCDYDVISDYFNS